MTTVNIGDAVAEMNRTERLARRCFQLNAASAMGAPGDREDIALWLERRLGYLLSLSTGELVVFTTGMAIYNGDKGATIADLRLLDNENRRAVLELLGEWLS